MLLQSFPDYVYSVFKPKWAFLTANIASQSWSIKCNLCLANKKAGLQKWSGISVSNRVEHNSYYYIIVVLSMGVIIVLVTLADGDAYWRQVAIVKNTLAETTVVYF